jgi:hypothetical protein
LANVEEQLVPETASVGKERDIINAIA